MLNRWLIGLFVIAILCMPSRGSAEPANAIPGPASGGPSGPEWAQEPQRLVRNWFGSLVASGSEDAWRALMAAFPVGEQGHARFRERVARNFGVVGTPFDFNLVGLRTIPNCDRWVQLIYLTYNERMPLAWEFTWYRARADRPWQLNLVRIESDAVYEFVTLSQLEFERLTVTPPSAAGAR